MRLTSIAIENFKGIRDRVEIELRPITLLFGPNSAGKSTILHALHYAREIFVHRNLNADQTVSGGSYLHLGGFRQFVHNHDLTRDIKLRLELWLNELEPFGDFDADTEIATQLTDGSGDDFLAQGNTVGVELTIAWSPFEGEPYVSSTKIFIDGELFAEITAGPNLRGSAIALLELDHPSLDFRFLSYTRTPEGIGAHRVSRLREAWEACGLGDLFAHRVLQLFGQQDALPDLDRPLSWTDEEINDLLRGLQADNRPGTRDAAWHVMLWISRLIVGPCQLIRDYLRDFRYLGPIRETPPQNYSPPRQADPSRWASGLGAWDILLTGGEGVMQEVSNWLGDADKLNSGYRLERRATLELDLSDPLLVKLITGRAFEEVEADETLSLDKYVRQRRLAVIPEGTELVLRPQDVGIGISQVVPVVVTALDGRERLLAMEQPELHLHPKLQAELGDLFIEAALRTPERHHIFGPLYIEDAKSAEGTRVHQFILETHSELIPLRLMRRIRESAEGTLPEGHPPVTASNVGIYYIETYHGATVITHLELSEQGQLLDPWPEGFFEEGFRERFHD